MKTYFLFLTLFLVSSIGFSQTTENQANTYFQKALDASKTTEFDSVRHYVRQAEGLLEASGNWEQLGNGINMVGRTLKRMDSLQQAIQLFHAYLPKIEKQLGEVHPVTAKMYAYLGDSYRKRENKEKSMEWFKKSLNSFKTLGVANSFVAHISRYQSEHYSTMGDNDRAIGLLKTALQIYRKVGDKRGEVRTLINIGVASNNVWEVDSSDSLYYHQAKQVYQTADKIIEEGLKIHKKDTELLTLKGISIVNKVDLEDFDFEKVIIELKKALAIFKQVQNSLLIGQTLESLGDAYQEVGDGNEAMRYYEQALDILKEQSVGQDRYIARIYLSTGEKLVNQGKANKALTFYQKALILLIPSFTDTTIIENPSTEFFYPEPLIMQALERKAHAFYQRYSNNQAIKDLPHALNAAKSAFQMVNVLHRSYQEDESKHQISEYIHETYKMAIHISMTLYWITEEFVYLEEAFNYSEQSKASVLKEVLKDMDAKQFANVSPVLLEKETNLYASMAYSKRKLFDDSINIKDTLKPYEDSLKRYQEELDILIEKIEKEYPKYVKWKYETDTVSIHSIQAQLAPKQALIEYFLGNNMLYSFVITKNTIQVDTAIISNKFLETLDVFRTAIKNKPDEFSRKAFANTAHWLYQQLLEKSLRRVKNEGITSLIIIPDGELGYIPFGALLTKPTKGSDLHILKKCPYLLQEYAIGYAYSASLAFKEKTNRNYKYTLGAFAPSYIGTTYEDFQELRDDATNITSNFNGHSWIGKKASKENFQKNAADYQILLLMGHGKADEKNTLNSKFIFYHIPGSTIDSVLTIPEIYGSELNAELTVLSACLTGHGALKRGEGIMSLARAFAYAGCPSVVMSLWNGRKESAGELMVYFYEELKKGKTKDEALQQAKLRFLEENIEDSFSYPYYWANFVPIGDMEAMDTGRGRMKWWVWLILIGVTFGVFFGLKHKKK